MRKKDKRQMRGGERGIRNRKTKERCERKRYTQESET